MPDETPQARIKRMTMRSWRRGTKEMDLILGPYADVHLAQMDEATLATFDVMLNENDQDISSWILGQVSAPPALDRLVTSIATFARNRLLR